MANVKRGPSRKRVTKPMPKPQGINPVEHNRTNAEDLAVAQVKHEHEKAERMRRTDHGKPGTFSPKNNAKFL